MNLILFFDKCKEKLTLEYRKYTIRKKINCTHSNFKVYGKILLINHNVRLGKNVRIYPEVMLFDDGAVIGAKSLVNGEIEPYSICVGIPAKKIKMGI